MEKQKISVADVCRFLLTLVLSLASGVLVLAFAGWMLVSVGVPGSGVQTNAADLAIMDRFDMQMTNRISSALDGVLAIEKVYWLNDNDLIAPEPDPNNFGTAQPADMEGFLEDAQFLLKGERTLFSTDLETYRGEAVTYYLDKTIMVITWRQNIDNFVYTISEVKIAHPSQFRRFLADGAFGSDKQYYTTTMAQTVNAVTASSGDYYKYRQYGIVVYDGQVMQFNNQIDTCFINDEGDMIFSRQGELTTLEEAQKFVDENNIRFSLAFGPVLVDNHQKEVSPGYFVGMVDLLRSRAALAKMGDLHYLLVTANYGDLGECQDSITVYKFTDQMMAFGVEKAYALDGGQTAVIVTNDQLINRPDWGEQRMISDIIYFATALQDGG